MADYADMVVGSAATVLLSASPRATLTNLIVPAAPTGGGGTTPVVTYTYRQRIWDTGNLQWVYYEQDALNATPLANETTPNHSGALKAASHEVMSVVRKVS